MFQTPEAAKMMSLLPLILLGIALPATQAIQYRKCELSQILREHGIDKDIPLPELICTMFHISGFDTQTEVNNNSNKEHGIFQISNNGWCAEKQEDVAKSVCGILCSKLLDDDITDDIVCAKKILQLPERLDYWKAHKTFCRENLDQWNC
ncbi:alpha-lactalbumin isoform X2 [Vombatus ursinus]|nr:alpha-lactalbumin isoform X2 [Vombatus ursinus]